MKITDEAVEAGAAALEKMYKGPGEDPFYSMAKNVLEAALPHLSQGAVRAPKGWVLVPREPTDQMLDAGSDAADGHFDIDADNGPWLRSSGFYSSYAAMLAFAPPSPVGVADDPIETSLKALGVTRTKATASKEAARRYIEKLEGRSPTDTQEGLSEASEVVAWLCEDQVMPDNHSVTLDGALAAYREKYGESYKITPLVRLSALTACQQEVDRLQKHLKERLIVERALRRLAEAAEARNAELVKALEPFALVAEHDISEDEGDGDIFWPISNARYSMAGRLRVGHLRRARATLGGQSNE